MTALKRPTAEMVGQKFGRYTVLEHLGCVGGRAMLSCLCECGNARVVMAQSLRAGTTLSCGCQRRDSMRASTRPGTHRDSHSREYEIWCGIRKRCENPNNHAYSRYGGRGIKVCERWRHYPNFLADMGRCPPGMSIDRINNDGDYEPSNCRWADRVTQGRNKRNCRRIVDGDTTLSLQDFQRLFGVPYATAYYRLVVSPNRADWARRGMDSVKSAADLFEDEE